MLSSGKYEEQNVARMVLQEYFLYISCLFSKQNNPLPLAWDMGTETPSLNMKSLGVLS